MTSSYISYLLGFLAVNSASARTLWKLYAEGRIEDGDMLLFFFLYGLASMAMQLPVGLISDRFKLNGRIFSAAGCLVCAVGVILFDCYCFIAAALFCAAGTALFISGAGTDALTQNFGYTRSGILFAAGALGSALGIKMADVDFVSSVYPLLALLLSFCLILFFCRHKRGYFELFLQEDDNKTYRPSLISKKHIALFLTGVTVLARSWSALALTPAESENSLIWLLPSAALAAGIFAGGIAADLISPDLVNSVSFFAASLMAVNAGESTLFYLAFLFFLGLTVPATLGNMTNLGKGREGLAVGLFSFCIFIGEAIQRSTGAGTDSPDGISGIPVVLLACAVLSFLSLPRLRSAEPNK